MIWVMFVLWDLVGMSKICSVDEMLLFKVFLGGFFVLVGVGSFDNFVWCLVWVIFVDEVDKYFVMCEGELIVLVEECIVIFGVNWLFICVCLLMVEDESWIEVSYKELD